jgi:hypothetical protein
MLRNYYLTLQIGVKVGYTWKSSKSARKVEHSEYVTNNVKRRGDVQGKRLGKNLGS